MSSARYCSEPPSVDVVAHGDSACVSASGPDCRPAMVLRVRPRPRWQTHFLGADRLSQTSTSSGRSAGTETRSTYVSNACRSVAQRLALSHQAGPLLHNWLEA